MSFFLGGQAEVVVMAACERSGVGDCTRIVRKRDVRIRMRQLCYYISSSYLVVRESAYPIRGLMLHACVL